MREFALYEGRVWKVIRNEHYGDKNLYLVAAVDIKADWLRWVHAKDCTPLDPALNILFERKEND